MEQLFIPQEPPESDDPQVLKEYIKRMFQDIAANFERISDGRIIEERNAAPPKPRNGMIAYADGVDWNPAAAGEGFHGYENGAWVKL